ncbi:hypothetical protein FRC11_013464 [Ceratobasidium sp. 423]|nr:hypothetical protein FRC11_013464 [Ceratobasidium sp. 423]
MPYGEEAIAAAKSREHLPPVYKPRVDQGASTSTSGATESGAGASGNESGASGTGNGTAQGTEDEPTITIRRPLLTAGELAQKSANASGPTDDRDLADQDPVLDPAMTISEEPRSIQDPIALQEDSKAIREDEVIQEEPESMNGDGDLPPSRDIQRRGDLQERLGETQEQNRIQVEPRARESPPDDPKDNRRESVYTTHSFVTATEGQGNSSPPTPHDSSPPTPTAETYQSQHQANTQAQVLTTTQTQALAGTQTQTQAPARTQTVLIPESRVALHPELTLVPATPIG